MKMQLDNKKLIQKVQEVQRIFKNHKERMDAIIHDCNCSKNLSKIPISDLPFREGLGNGFGFGHKASIVTTKVITTKINLDSDFFSSNVFTRNHQNAIT